MRQIAGRAKQPKAAILGSQPLKTTKRGGTHGYDGAQKLNGRKRHSVVDTGGLPMRVKVHAADIPDLDGVRLLLASTKRALQQVQHVWGTAAGSSGGSSSGS